MRRHMTAVFVMAMLPVFAAAQQFLTPPGASPTIDPNLRFEVVSVKPANDSSGPMMIRMTPAGFESSNLPIGVLLRQALQKPDYQVLGAPGWIDTDRYTIRAKPPEGAPLGAMSVLLSNLLKDRFQLAMHLETREQPIFHLVTARADRRLGDGLTPTSADCQATLAEQQAAARRGDPPRPLPGMPGGPPLPDPNGPQPCGFGRISPGVISFSGRTIEQLVPSLSDLLARPVIDKTELTGLFDISLKFAYEGRLPGPMGPLGPPPGAPPPEVDPNAPSLSAALQEQLGLKLESARGPVEVAVIDRLEKPTVD